MILPEDTKAPIIEDDSRPSLSMEQTPFLPYTDEPSHPSQPYPYALTEDLEMGSTLPPPAYTPTASSSSSSSGWEPTKPKSYTQIIRAHSKIAALGLIFGYLLYGSFFWGIHGFGVFHRGPPGGPHPPHGPHHGLPHQGDHYPSENEKQDGSPRECITWDSTAWRLFNPDNNHNNNTPNDPAAYFSQNKTLFIDARKPETWVHVFGDSAISKVFIDVLNDGEEESSGVMNQSDNIRVIVEPIILVLDKEMDVDIDNSPGLEVLEHSRVCLMDRNETTAAAVDLALQEESIGAEKNDNGDEEPLEDRNDRPGPGPHRPAAQGVGLYTYKPEEPIHPNPPNNPLSFRLYISLPKSISAESKTNVLESVWTALAGRDNSKREKQDALRSFEFRGGVSNVNVDVGEAKIGRFEVVSGVGGINLRSLVAEVVKVSINGDIGGRVGVSVGLEVDSPTGHVDLDVTLAKAPEEFVSLPRFEAMRHRTSNSDESKPGCGLPPVKVDVQAASGSTKLRYVGWEESCRRLKQEITSAVGTVDVIGHPNFEGPFKFQTTIGSIDVQVPKVDDPSGQGRSRKVTLDKHDRLGSRTWQGKVEWRKTENELESDVEELQKRGGRFARNHKKAGLLAGLEEEGGMFITNSVGSIGVTL